MNKQELINELKRISLEKQHKALTHPESKNYYEGMVMAYSQVVHMVNTVLKLDEPQKPVVPQFVAEWFEEHKDDLDSAIFGYLVFWEERDISSDLYQWFAKSKNKPIETLVRMKDGYEVEKLKKYIVKIGKLYLKEPLGDTSNSTILTSWDKKCAYPFSNFHMADKNAAKFDGTVEELAEG